MSITWWTGKMGVYKMEGISFIGAIEAGFICNIG